MNAAIKHMTQTQETKIKNLDENEQRRYKAGLLLFASFIREDFLDLPILPDNKYGTRDFFTHFRFFMMVPCIRTAALKCCLSSIKLNAHQSVRCALSLK
ncbi:hypothetical protein [Metabacillus sp. SLBN-84]